MTTDGSESPSGNADYIGFTADILSAFVSNNSVPVNEVPSLLASIHAAVVALNNPPPKASVEAFQEPAVPIKKSVTSDFIICLEDGKKFKSLRRHLSVLGLTPDEYRAKWGLPKDYPMVAPSYSATRSAFARQSGLGQKAVEAQPVEEAAKPRRGRPRRAA